MTVVVNKRGFSNLILVLALAFIVINWSASFTRTDASGPLTPALTETAEMQTARQEKTAEQVRKNIQVLKGLPDSQLFLVMNFIGDSLGVHCDYCHVKQGTDPNTGRDNWLWERDDKPEKVRAREMIRMVLDINKATFGGDQVVTCYSCHRGATSVERVVPLPPPDFARAKAGVKGAGLPTAEQILNKYMIAVRGQDGGAKFNTIVLRGVVEGSQGRNDPVEITIKGPDKYLLKLSTPQGVVMQGINGTVGWVRNNDKPRQLAAADLEQLKRAAALYSIFKVTEQPAQMIALASKKIDDREAYAVAFRVTSHMTREYFFDAQTGLLLRMVTTTNTMLVPLPEQVDFEDYRDVGGVKVPFTIRTSDVAAFDTTTRRFTDIRQNVIVDDSIFNMPAANK